MSCRLSIRTLAVGLSGLLVLACGPTDANSSSSETSAPDPSSAAAPATEQTAIAPGDIAAVENVSVSGEPGRYQFSVTVRSQETGCDQYADWWEVVSESGELLYRRILAHSHVDEQPFTRSGGPVPVQPGDLVTVRVHMNNTGYSPEARQGTVSDGAEFEAVTLVPDFAAALAQQDPLPSGCTF